MQPKCSSEIKISSPRNFLVQVRSRRQHSQHCHSPVPGECELCRSFALKKIFTLPMESHPIHFPGHVTDSVNQLLFRLSKCQEKNWEIRKKLDKMSIKDRTDEKIQWKLEKNIIFGKYLLKLKKENQSRKNRVKISKMVDKIFKKLG